ncbi:MAG: hypothetical protein U1F27_01800 [Turneriella sp.]
MRSRITLLFIFSVFFTPSLIFGAHFDPFRGCTCSQVLTQVNEGTGVQKTKEPMERPGNEIEIMLSSESFAVHDKIVIQVRLSNMTWETYAFGEKSFSRDYFYFRLYDKATRRMVPYCALKTGESEIPSAIEPMTKQDIKIVNFAHRVREKWFGISERCPLKAGTYLFGVSMASSSGYRSDDNKKFYPHKSVEFSVHP